MLILQSPANAGVRTVSGLWKFKNKEKYDDGISFNELCAIGSKIATGHRGFPGNLFAVYGGLSENDDLVFKFGYQPSASESDVSADDLQQQFADFFAQHTQTYLGWEITSDKTPEVEVKVAPLPRNNGYWNNLPILVQSNNETIDGNEILNAWGLKAWGFKGLPSNTGDYDGWQRVGLPSGWTISLEGYNFLLVDDFNQVRGRILDVFNRPKHTELSAIISEALGSNRPKTKRKRPAVKKPCLQLQTSICISSSFCLGDEGPYDYWVENAAGEHLFGIYDQPVAHDEAEERLPKLRQRIFDWLAENYPDWQNHNAYWDVFPQAHVRWLEAKQMAYSVAVKILEGKTDEDLKALRSEIGVGEQRTDYTLAMQESLSDHFGEKPSYRVTNIVVEKMIDIFDMRIGRVDH